MIHCDGERCPGNNWYHLECVGMTGRRNIARLSWFCPPCEEKKKKISQREKEQMEKLKSKTLKRVTVEEVLDENKYVLSKNDRNPLKVESAERQSREAMDELARTASLLHFDATSGQLIIPSSDGHVSNDRNSINCKRLRSNVGGDVAVPSHAARTYPWYPSGLCRMTLQPTHFQALQSLHRVIVDKLFVDQRLTPWAGVGESDARRRGYAFLPAMYGSFGKNSLTKAGIKFHAAEKRSGEARRDEAANWHSCVRLAASDISPAQVAALEAVVAVVRAAVAAEYRPCISLSNLQALQPNLHSGLDHLPAHMDSPLHDGFGVVIVTVCVHQSANILMVNAAPTNTSTGSSDPPSSSSSSSLSSKEKKNKKDRKECWWFQANEGDLYVLSGAARNSFDHGVICPLEKRRKSRSLLLPGEEEGEEDDQQQGKEGQRKRRRTGGKAKNRPLTDPVGRESLNLRFGLHSSRPGQPFNAFEEMPLFFEGD